MKKNIVITFLLLLFSVSLSSNELAWVDKQIEAIKPARSGLVAKNVDTLKNPFIIVEEKKLVTTKSGKKVYVTSKKSKKSRYKTSRRYYSLNAIMNNSALINGRWYKLNDSVGGYKLRSIAKTHVVLVKGSKKLKLTTYSKNRNLKFK